MKKITATLLFTAMTSVSMMSHAEITIDANKSSNPFARWGVLAGNFDITSNYVFRGTSQSNNTPAVQGGLTYTFTKPGIYLSGWGSNVNYFDAQGHQATVELDSIIGIANPITDNLSYDISLARYNYPKAGAANYNELIGILTYRFLKGTIGYTPNVYNTHRTGTYYEAGVNLDIPAKYAYFEGISAQGAVGYYSLPKTAGYNSYKNYLIGLNKAISNYKLSLQWIGTDGRAKLGALDENRIVGTILANF